MHCIKLTGIATGYLTKVTILPDTLELEATSEAKDKYSVLSSSFATMTHLAAFINQHKFYVGAIVIEEAEVEIYTGGEIVKSTFSL